MAWSEGGQEGGCEMTRPTGRPPASVPEKAKQAGDAAPTGNGQNLPPGQTACWREQGLSPNSPCTGPPVLSQVNHRPESRMREIRTYGSEGGGTGTTRSFLPLSSSQASWLVAETTALVADRPRIVAGEGLAANAVRRAGNARATVVVIRVGRTVAADEAVAGRT